MYIMYKNNTIFVNDLSKKNDLFVKERQGVFFEKPTERIHFPDNAELKKKDR